MALTLYSHPLAAFCHKVLIALYENGTEFIPVTVDLGEPEETAALAAKWAVGKIPVLRDDFRDRTVPETSIIIEYLDRHYPGPAPMLPADAERRLDARLWDRFFDLYVSVPMQKVVTDRIRPEGGNDPVGVADARRTLDTAYVMIERQLADKNWAAGEDFTIADCAAAPGLFYASIVHPFASDQHNLAAYFERLMARPSVRRTVGEARPYFRFFPYRELMPERFLHD
ncbi:glutathione S-transferase [Aminobacter sp. Y103A]|uniref:glutathione S-transferase family protein n=1 Tax=unclassified Aminobacter TaxID=2644704 RepID=UPI0012B004D8|nr:MULTISPECIES: glutathione S-transferase family protein [unclassified Aminobacter]MRX35229.1 glutathione S-transferase family protein [Aminobacter sp. MDW-2]QNH36167.1 glutathione S-transferase family protein [Aminobacter sp. MDW-2]BBD39661.1 glutathione S-transferase [Aminobacter sp. SS-2016]